MTKIGIFLDRDGVLNINTHYPHLIEDCYPAPTAKKAMERILADDRFIPIVVTNQGGVGQGHYSKRDCFSFQLELMRQLDCTIPRRQWYHSWATEDNHFLRKPNPGMLLRAAQDHDIDLGQSAMFGDKESDMLAGIKAGCCAVYLIGEGRPSLFSQVDAFMEATCQTTNDLTSDSRYPKGRLPR